jgi:hypothetical protein
MANEAVDNLYSVPDIIKMIKWGRIQWVGHLARMGVGWEKLRQFSLDSLKGRDCTENLNEDEMIIKMDFSEGEDCLACTGFIWLR